MSAPFTAAQEAAADLDGLGARSIRLECLKIALVESSEQPEAVVARASVYADFVMNGAPPNA